ncbi:MAG: hypothetical protein AB8G11_23860 [Saprospiraceae bacterium]
MIQIANPIYDVVFKFMMSDNKVAKLLLSAIIGNEIIDLKFEPTETQLSIQDSITVLRMDFKATVQYDDGSQQVIIIELQKAKLHSDIMRFRRYLGKQYEDKNNSIVTKSFISNNGKLIERRKAIPILSIYFLGYPLDGLDDVPVVKVARNYIDIATGEIIKYKTPFIESLTHDSFIIQIPFVLKHRRTELEQLLYIFGDDEDDKNPMTKHFLNISENEIPKRYQPVLRRLLEAFANAKVRETMEAEDDIIQELQDYTRMLQEKEFEIQQKDSEIQQKDSEIQQKDSEIQQKDSEIQQKDSEIEQKDSEIEQKNKALEEKDQAIINAIKRMLAMNISIEEIATMFRKSVDFVKNIK